MLSRPPINASFVLFHNSIAHDNYVEQYTKDEDFKDVYEVLTHGNQVDESNYHVYNKLLYHLGKLCIPKDERIHVIRESHTSLISIHFWVSKTMVKLRGYCY